MLQGESGKDVFKMVKEVRFGPQAIVIVVFVEFFVLHFLYSAIYDFSEVKNVVSEVEFGATLISIVLAVVAILYTFWQGISQGDFNATLMGQLGRLEKIGSDLSTNNERLHENVVHSKNISDDLTRIGSAVFSVKDEVSSLGSVLQTFVAPARANSVPSVPVIAENNTPTTVQRTKSEKLAEWAILFGSPMARKAVVYSFSRNNINMEEPIEVCKDFTRIEEPGKEDDKAIVYLYGGALLTVMAALRAAGVIATKKDLVPDDKVKIVEVVPEWRVEVENFLSKQRGDASLGKFIALVEDANKL
ncbi:hypothetical protein [Burkholderia stagnalis]|uniref:hypothetical protein n=1 Tax=Burkholderia stagnalis TaxID=1503054 RepID=UPI000F5AF4D0|nr:hypothetical protein [Burkholderia stagnalis]